MKAENGGPAFPLQSIGVEHPPGYAGMSLREYYAGQAMLTVFAPGGPLNEWAKESQTMECALRCIDIADCMIAALNHVGR